MTVDRTALNRALAMPDVRSKLVEQGSEITPGTPDEFGRFIRGEYDRWKKVVKDANLSAD